MVEDDNADHAFLDGRLRLREPRRGHRSGTDAILLAAASRLAPGEHLVDVGAGAGAAALAALSRVEDATATLVERDGGMAALARHNVEVNGLADRAEVIHADLFDGWPCDGARARQAQVVISNPPFFTPDTVRSSTVPQRVASYVLDRGDHGQWLQHLLRLVDRRGRVVLIHRPEALPALMRGAGGRAALRVRAVHADAGRPALRIVVSAYLGSRAPFVIEPPLVLHEAGGRFTGIAEELHRGRAWL